MTRRFWIPLVLAIAATAGGCSCDNDNEQQQSVSITSPKSAATLTLDDDVDNTAAGLQFEVKVATAHFATDGSTAAKLFVDGKEHAQATIGSDGTATLVVDTSALAIPDGSHILSVTATDAAGSAQSAKVAVVVDLTEIPCTVRITTPADNAILNAKSDVDASRAGVQTDVVVHTAGCSGGKVRVCLKGEGLTGTACKGNEGIAVAEADLSPTNTTTLRTDWVEGPVDVYAEHDSTTVTEAEPVNVTVDSLAPTCSFPSLVDGETLNSQNVYVVVQTSNAEVGQPVVLTSSLKPEAMSGTVTATGEANVAAILPLGEQVLTAHVSDQSGNDGSCSITVTVDVDGCDATFTDPSTSQYVFNASNAPDGKYTVRGHTSRCPEGKAHFSKTVGGVVTELGTADADTNGDFSMELTFADGETDATLTVHVEKEGYTSNAGTFFNYTADYSAPTCTFVSPTDGAIVTTQTPTVRLQVEGAGTGQTVTLSTSGKPETMTGTTTAGGEVSIAASLPLGEQTLTATFKDKAGNEGSCSITVTVNGEGCDVVLEDPATPELIVNIANGNPSGDPLQGSYTIKGTTSRCKDGTVTFTKTIGGVAGTPGTATVDSDGNFSFAVTFADGESDATLNVRIDGTNTAPNAGVDIAYFSDFTAPQVVQAVPEMGNLYIVNAANSHLVAGEAGYVEDEDPATAGGQVSANLTLSGIGSVATAGFGSALTGSATLAMGTTTETLLETSGNGEQTASAALDLAEGYAGTLVLTLTDSAGNSTTAQWNAKVSTVALPTLAINNPRAGTINVFKDLGGDRATYVTVQASVAFGTTPPQGAQIVMCSTIQFGGASAGCLDGYYEIPGTRVTVTSTATSQFYGGLVLPQGEQDIVAQMIDSVGDTVTSAPVHLIVDTIPPVVTGVAATNDLDHNGTIAGSELAQNQDATFTATITGAEGRQASFTTTDSTGKISTTFAVVTSGLATFVIKGIPDGAFSGKVSVTSANGNPNASTAVTPPIVNAAASMSVVFQRIAPSVSVVAPNFSVCNQARQKPSPSGPGICDLDFTVSVGSTTTRVDFSVSPSNAATLSETSVTAFTNGRATSTYALTQSTTPVVLAARAYDGAGNYRDATWTMTLIDTVEPSLSITSPAEGTTEFTQRFPITVETDAEAGQFVTVTSSYNSQVVGTGTVVAGSPNTATFEVSVPGTNQTLFATVTDLAGNVSPTASVNIVMNLAGCDVNFTNPSSASPIFNATTAPGGLVHISGNTTRDGCSSTTINFTAAINGASATNVGSTTAVGGLFSFDYTFPDGSVVVFEGKSTAAGSTANGFTAITDITPPTLTINAPVPNASESLFVVAKSGNLNVKAGTAGYVPELDDTISGGQVLFQLDVSGAGPSAGVGTGVVEIADGTAPAYSLVSSTNAAQSLGPTVTLEQAYVGQLGIRAADYAGNVVSATWNLAVDVVPPPTPQLVTTDPGNGQYTHVTDNRAANAVAWFITPADDGPSEQSLAWKFGYTTSTLLAGAVFDQAAFDNPDITTYINLGSVGTPGTAVSAIMSGIPTFNTLHFTPVLVDGAGNSSPIADSTLPLQLTKDTLAPPSYVTGAANYGSPIAMGGDIDGDGLTDFAAAGPLGTVSGIANAGAVVVYYGSTTWPLQRTQVFSGASGDYLGRAIALGDINGDGLADLLMRSGANTIQVYLSQGAGQQLPATRSFTFTNSGGTALSSIRIISDLNDDNIREILIGDYSTSSSKGTVYVISGRSSWPTGGTFDVAAAGNAICAISGTDAAGRLGWGAGLIDIPDVDGDGKRDLVVPAYFSTANKAYIFGSKAILASPTLSTANSLQMLTTSLATSGFGNVAASVRVDPDDIPDLMVANGANGLLFAYSGQAGSTFVASPNQAAWLTNPNTISSIVAGDLSGDGRNDVFVGVSGVSGRVLSFWSRSNSLSPTSGSSLLGGAGFGSALGLADLDGDGKPDLVVGETNNGAGNVYVYH